MHFYKNFFYIKEKIKTKKNNLFLIKTILFFEI